MAWPLRDHCQKHEAELAVFEQPPVMAAAKVPLAVMMARVVLVLMPHSVDIDHDISTFKTYLIRIGVPVPVEVGG